MGIKSVRICILTVLVAILLSNFAICDPIPDEYYPFPYHDGYKAIEYRVSVGSDNSETTSKLYYWVHGLTDIAGVACWSRYQSGLGFYQGAGGGITHIIHFLARTNNEYRYYGSNTLVQSQGIRAELRYDDDFQTIWKYGLEPGSQYDQTYVETTTYYSGSQVTLQASYCFKNDFEIVGYEDVSTPFGNYQNCLKFIINEYSSGSSDCTFTNPPAKHTYWLAAGVGEVKHLWEEANGNVSTNYLSVKSDLPIYYLEKAIVTLKVLSGMKPTMPKEIEIDGEFELKDVVYALQFSAGLR